MSSFYRFHVVSPKNDSFIFSICGDDGLVAALRTLSKSYCYEFSCDLRDCRIVKYQSPNVSGFVVPVVPMYPTDILDYVSGKGILSYDQV